MRALIVAMAAVLSCAAVARAGEPVKFDKSQLVGGDIPKQYRPDYPVEARRLRQTGSGVFILHVDRKSGEVISISVQKSTGYKLLDTAVLASCIHWRFKPASVSDVQVPMTFSTHGPFP
jgi:TonB family protein